MDYDDLPADAPGHDCPVYGPRAGEGQPEERGAPCPCAGSPAQG